MLRYSIAVACWLFAANGVGFGQSIAGFCELRGSIVDEKGTPVAGLFLTAYSSRIVNGRRLVELAGLATTNNAGEYCMRSLLRPGPVFLLTTEWFNFKGPDALRHSLPSTWYPGVADFRLAKSVEPGTNARADFRLASANTFVIEGKTTGITSFGKINLTAENQGGIVVQNGVLDIDVQQQTFKIQGVSPGDWTFAVVAEGADQVLYARLHYGVDRDIHDAVLAFAREPQLELYVNGKPFRAGEETATGVTLQPYQPAAPRDGTATFWYSPFSPGAYKLIVDTGFECVESFSPGDVPLDANRLIIGLRNYTQPVSAKIGKHCATLTIRLPDGVSGVPKILLVPESLPFQPITIPGIAAELPYVYDLWPLAPGTYRVYAFKTLDGVEYENPAVLGRFAGRTVVLEPDRNTKVNLDKVNEAL